MIKVDLSGAAAFFDAAGPDYAAAAAAHRMLAEKSGPGAEFTGWTELPMRIKRGELKALLSASAKIRSRSKALVVVGIGGSYLGARGAIELLRPLREHADFIIDTTLMPAAKLRNELYRLFGDKSARSKLSVNVVSFGFKYGIPLEADLVFDVRFLPNPFYVPDLKRKTGMDSEVYDYVFSFPQTKTFIEKLEGMLSFLLPLYAEEGKSTLVIAVGCTGGHHRSVALVARCVAAYLTELGYPAFENHRDITRG